MTQTVSLFIYCLQFPFDFSSFFPNGCKWKEQKVMSQFLAIKRRNQNAFFFYRESFPRLLLNLFFLSVILHWCLSCVLEIASKPKEEERHLTFLCFMEKEGEERRRVANFLSPSISSPCTQVDFLFSSGIIEEKYRRKKGSARDQVIYGKWESELIEILDRAQAS